MQLLVEGLWLETCGWRTELSDKNLIYCRPECEYALKSSGPFMDKERPINAIC
jgi:hypothetical protein